MTTRTASKILYDHPSDMEPLLLGDGDTRSAALALALIRGAERLRASLHPITRALVADLVRSMNSYYSNLIEGHRTRPWDIDAALRKDFSANPAQRSLQIQHLAHMEVQAEMETRLRTMPASAICSVEFLCWLHEGFYRRLPEEFRKVEDEKAKAHEVQPGKLRESEVSVGRHMAPASKKLRQFLDRFAEFYGPLGDDKSGVVGGRGFRSPSPDLDSSVPGWQRTCGAVVHPGVVRQSGYRQRRTVDNLTRTGAAEGELSSGPGQRR